MSPTAKYHLKLIVQLTVASAAVGALYGLLTFLRPFARLGGSPAEQAWSIGAGCAALLWSVGMLLLAGSLLRERWQTRRAR